MLSAPLLVFHDHWPKQWSSCCLCPHIYDQTSSRSPYRIGTLFGKRPRTYRTNYRKSPQHCQECWDRSQPQADHIVDQSTWRLSKELHQPLTAIGKIGPGTPKHAREIDFYLAMYFGGKHQGKGKFRRKRRNSSESWLIPLQYMSTCLSKIA